VRCIVCLKTGEWPARLKDVSETDVIAEQLESSEHVDAESRSQVLAHVHDIDEAARQRGRGGEC
jgi:hypothetical protein